VRTPEGEVRDAALAPDLAAATVWLETFRRAP
jgi:hypothetical protein